MSDSQIRQRGIEILKQYLGVEETERFIALIKSKPFDYTEWRKNLWKDKSIDDICKDAKDFYEKNKN